MTAAARDDGALLTPAEAVALAGVSSRTLIRWAEAGVLASYRTPGGHRRYSRAEVERLAAARRPAGLPRLAVLADVMGVRRETAWAWARAGKLPGAVLAPDGCWHVPQETIDAIIAGQAPRG